MSDEKIQVSITETGQTMDVVVFNKRADQIDVVIGEGVHSVKCELTPTRLGNAYVGKVMGREIIYNRSRDDVHAEIEERRNAIENPRRR